MDEKQANGASGDKSGFNFRDDTSGKIRRISFMEPMGKDISFERWRITLYYHRHFAATAFFDNAVEYEAFIKKHAAECYEDYSQFVSKIEGA